MDRNLRIGLLNPRKESSVKKPLSRMKSAKPIILNTGLLGPNTPKTNGMVERADGIIKKGTILKENYANIYIEHGRNTEEMNEALMASYITCFMEDMKE